MEWRNVVRRPFPFETDKGCALDDASDGPVTRHRIEIDGEPE